MSRQKQTGAVRAVMTFTLQRFVAIPTSAGLRSRTLVAVVSEGNMAQSNQSTAPKAPPCLSPLENVPCWLASGQCSACNQQGSVCSPSISPVLSCDQSPISEKIEFGLQLLLKMIKQHGVRNTDKIDSCVPMGTSEPDFQCDFN